MPDFTPVIRLEENEHVYTVQTEPDGPFITKANVSTILETLLELEQFNSFVDTTTGNTIPGDMVRQAGGYGTAFHKGAHILGQGKQLDMGKLPEVLHHDINELIRWQRVEEVVTVASEMKCYCPKLDVCGTLDRVFHMARNDVLNLVDFKTSKVHPAVGPQTWSYEKLYRAMTGYKGMMKRWLWESTKEGEYKFVELTDNLGDEHEFRSRLFDYFWRRRLR